MCAPQARRASRLVVLAASLLAAAGCARPSAAAGDPPPAAPPLDPTPPAQIEFPAGQSETGDANLDREAVSRFAWRTFVAVNWPARAAGPRGTPDPENRFRDTSGPTVWATWKSQEDLYPDDAKPKPWADDTAMPAVAVFDKDMKRKQYQLRELAARGGGKMKVLGQLTAINQAAFLPGGGGAPLVDQNGKLVRYEVRVNQKAYERIFNDKLYLREELRKLPENGGVFPDGAVNIKAAWKELPDDPAVRARYYHTKAEVLTGWNPDKSPRTEERVVGLVGLHVVTKVDTRKSWVWSTFEHVDNLAPPPGAAVASLRDPALTAPDNAPRHPRVEPGVALPTGRVQVGPKDRSLHDGVAKANAAYRSHPGLAASPWQHYQLVGVQWARSKVDGALVDDGTPPAIGRMLPAKTEPVRNATMETFLPESSCLRCHGPSVGEEPRRFPFVFYPDFLALPPL